MLSLLIHLISMLWTRRKSPPLIAKELEPAANKVENKKYCKGIVTNINLLEEYGTINKEIYFSFDIVNGNSKLSVGDSVLVNACRDDLYHAWYATSVSLAYADNNAQNNCISKHKPCLKTQMNVKNMEHKEMVDLVVIECNCKFGKLENDLYFNINDGEIDFTPIVGDILSVNLSYTSEGKKVISWRPKEIKCIEGVVTACENDCGIINDDIVFFISSCKCKVHIFVGQNVSAMITTSKHGIFHWRAYSLCSSCSDIEPEITRKPCFTDFEGLFITNPLNFDNVYLGQENSLTITLHNKTNTELTFIDCYLQNKNHSQFFLAISKASIQTISKNTAITITLHCKTEAFGQHEDILFFEFLDFIIKRNVTVNIIDPVQNILKPTAPFSFKGKNSHKQFDSDNLVIIPGERHFKPGLGFYNKLPPCPVPRNLLDAVKNRTNLIYIVPCLFENLTMDNYISKFKTLLYLEEIQMRDDIKRFDLFEATLQRTGIYLSLKVPGLAEGRPSLVIGDKAILVPPHDSSEFAFEGYIHEVQKGSIFLKFNDSFQNTYDGKSYNIRFQFSRTNFRRLHQCVHHALENHEYALFPHSLRYKIPLITINSDKHHCKSQLNPLTSKSIKWKNTKLNWKQKEAVLRILEARCRPLPYIIFGPPGTGKTVTLVEAILQVFINIPDSHIIVCTPSNSAADLVAQRILECNLVTTNDMIRLNSYQRCIDTIPDFIQPYCQDKHNIDTVVNYRIVISTCSTAGSLYSIGLCNEFFTHVFLDEAGQLMEPESMIAVGFVDSETQGQIVMAGDPQQLGPVLRSSICKTHGLQISYLERLMNTALYSRNKSYEEFGGYNPLLMTMLEESYRSHPDILRFPSETFYFSQVKCCVPRERHDRLSNWEELPKKGFPIIFHGIKGEELREENSPSWFNPTEVVQVTNYLQKLYNYGLTSDEVGIIAPYKKQVEKIRLLLNSFDLEFCKIGSVEEFQGQERRAIIISTVRSSDQYVNCDIIYNLGFISNPKRLNVAITRSQELLIVVGNPYILSKDYFWDSFIRYCVINGCYIGCEPPLSLVQCTNSNV